MKSLFETQENTALDILGLSYLPEYIGIDEQDSLIARIDKQPWLTDLKRRVQHYGYKYDYKAGTINGKLYLGPLPEWLLPLCQKLHQEQIFSSLPDQVIVNEYLPGQGISAHIDCVPCFGETIASLSLGSSCIMQLTNPQASEKQEVFLEERSLIILSGAARYHWQHAIPARKSDNVSGCKIERKRRLSLTFRTVILD